MIIQLHLKEDLQSFGNVYRNQRFLVSVEKNLFCIKQFITHATVFLQMVSQSGTEISGIY